MLGIVTKCLFWSYCTVHVNFKFLFLTANCFWFDTGLPLKPTLKINTTEACCIKPEKTNNGPSKTSLNNPTLGSRFKARTNYFIEKELDTERRRELSLKGEGLIKSVSHSEDTRRTYKGQMPCFCIQSE